MSRKTIEVEKGYCDQPYCGAECGWVCRGCQKDICNLHAYTMFAGDSNLLFYFGALPKRNLLPWYLCFGCAEAFQGAIERVVDQVGVVADWVKKDA